MSQIIDKDQTGMMMQDNPDDIWGMIRDDDPNAMQNIQKEYNRLQTEKEAINRQYKADRQEMRQLLIVRENVRRILDTEPQPGNRKLGRSTR